MKNRISSVSVSGGSSSVYRMSTNDAGVEIKAGNAVACRYASCAAVFLCRSAPAGRSAQSAGGSLWSRGLSISSLKLPALRGKRIINAQSRQLKFLESLVAISPEENIHGMQILGLALEFTFAQSS